MFFWSLIDHLIAISQLLIIKDYLIKCLIRKIRIAKLVTVAIAERKNELFETWIGREILKMFMRLWKAMVFHI
jgi:hypothetical protein